MRSLALLPLLLALACTSDKDTGTESTGSTASTSATGSTASTDATTTTDGTTAPSSTDVPTGPLTDTTASTTGTTSAPVGDCAFLAGKTFKSDNELECGLGPNGVELCNWTLRFTADTYDHQYSDVGESGTYTCEDGVIKAVDGFDKPHAGTIDADTGALVWDDIGYHVE